MVQLGYTALMYGAGSDSIVDMLVKAGAKLDPQNWVGNGLIGGSITELSSKDNNAMIGTIYTSNSRTLTHEKSRSYIMIIAGR